MDKKLCMQAFGMCIFCANTSEFHTPTAPPPLPHQGKPQASDYYWVLYSLSECLGWVGSEFKPQVTSLTASYHQVVQ